MEELYNLSDDEIKSARIEDSKEFRELMSELDKLSYWEFIKWIREGEKDLN